MLTVYILSTIIGGGLLLLSAFVGHDHDSDFSGGHDVDHSADHDVSHDHDGTDHTGGNELLSWLPFLSLRFWTYGFALFGGVGWGLTALTNTSSGATLGWAIGAALLMGTLATTLMNVARRMSSDSSTRTQDLLGVEGKVTVPVHGLSEGKVRVNLKGDSIDFLALSNDNRSIESGESVVIVAVENDRLRVIPRADILEELP